MGIEENRLTPSALRLSLRVYSNPIKAQTALRNSLPNKSKISLVPYNISGRLVKSVINEEKNPGIYKINFKTNELSTGIYFVSLKVDNKKSLINRLVIVK